MLNFQMNEQRVGVEQIQWWSAQYLYDSIRAKRNVENWSA